MNYNITIPQQSVTFINLAGMILISVIIIIGFILLMRYSAKLMPGFMGLLCYLLLVVVGTELITFIIASVRPLASILLGQQTAFCFTRAVIAAALSHATRLILIKFTDRNQDMQLGDALMGGLGIAIGEAIVVGTSLIYLSALASTVNTYGLEALLADVSQAEQAEMIEYVSGVASILPVTFLMQALNYALDIVFQVAVLLLLYAVVKKGLPVFWHGIVVAVNIVFEALSLFASYSILDYNIVVITKLIILIGIIGAALRVDADYLGGELRSFSKMRKQKDAMPKFGNVKKK